MRAARDLERGHAPHEGLCVLARLWIGCRHGQQLPSYGQPAGFGRRCQHPIVADALEVRRQHTHSRRLDFHPHVHLVVPAAAVDAAKQRWRRKRRGKNGTYLFNEKAMAKVFRAKMLAAIEAAGISLPACYPREWVAHCKSVGSGEKALIYLARYLYRGVIREQDILACDNGRVTFRYRNADTGKLERRSLAGADFLWLILQHMLPKGFRRARNFGFLHTNCKRLIGLLPLLLKFDPNRFTPPRKERPPMLCSCCGAVMAIVRTRIRLTSPGVVAVPPLVGVAI